MFLIRIYDLLTAIIEKLVGRWFLGAVARFIFASVLFNYFYNSFLLKVGKGFPGIFQVQDNAYSQIIPLVVESYGYDVSKIPFFPYDIIVYAGAYAEVILPVLIIIGLFTRIAAAGMLVFVAVQTYVDIFSHNADNKAIGALFDNIHNSEIADQRLLWSFILIYLALRGAGFISVDGLLRFLHKTKAKMS